MSYWGDDVESNDFAFGAVGVAMLWLKDRLFRDLEVVTTKEHPEQSIAAYICCLRLLGERFRNNLGVHFGKRDLARAREGFDRWFKLVEAKLPAERKDAIRAAAEQEFALFEERIFKKKAADADDEF